MSDGRKFSGANHMEAVCREFSWAESDRLDINVASECIFERAAQWKLTLCALAESLDSVRVEAGRIGLKPGHSRVRKPLSIRLSGPQLREVTLNAAGTLHLGDLAQEIFVLRINGSACARATGYVDVLDVELNGSGQATMDGLTTQVARVAIRGSGRADIKALTDASITISGSGNVALHSRPTRLNVNVRGSGRTFEVPAGASGWHSTLS
jgi:hypothetical protein